VWATMPELRSWYWQATSRIWYTEQVKWGITRRSAAKKNWRQKSAQGERVAFLLVIQTFLTGVGELWPTRRSPPLSLKHSIKLLLFGLSLRDWIL